MPSSAPLLVMRDIDKRFQGVHALAKASLEVQPGRGHGAGRPERGRQVDADQGADGRLQPRRRLDRLRRAADRLRLAPGGAAGRDQHHLPGNQSRPLPVGDREHLPRPRAPPFRPPGLEAHERGGGRAAAAVRRRDRRPPAAFGLFDRHPADGRHRPGGVVQGAARHHGRADLFARRTRSGGAFRRHAAAEVRGRRRHLHHPSPRRALSGLRPGDRDARRPHDHDAADGRGRQASSHLRDARARRRGRPRPRDRLLRRRGTRGRRGPGGRGVADRAARARLPGRGSGGSDRRPCGPARLGPDRDGARDLRRRSAGRGIDPADGQGGYAARAFGRDRHGRRLLQRGPQGGRHRAGHVGARESHARDPAAARRHGRDRRGTAAANRRKVHETARHQGLGARNRRSANFPAATSRRCCSPAGSAPIRSS